MVGLLVFDSILVFFDIFYFTHKVIFLLYETQTILLPLHIILLSLLVLNFKFTCVLRLERGGYDDDYATFGI